MTITQLKYFVSVYESLSISKSAATLFVSQPAITQSIIALEKEFETKLFIRNGKTLVNTAQGLFFYEKAKLILQDFKSLSSRMKELSQEDQVIHIGVPPMIGAFLFPKIFIDFTTLYSNIKFSILESGSLNIRKHIEDKTIDLGLTILDELVDDAYNTIPILNTELYFCISRSNPLSQKEILSINDIQDENLILMKEGSFQNQFIHHLYASANKEPKVVLYSSQLNTIKKFISLNTGGAFLFKELIDNNEPDIVGIPLSEEFKIQIGLIWAKNAKPDKSQILLINFLKKWKY